MAEFKEEIQFVEILFHDKFFQPDSFDCQLHTDYLNRIIKKIEKAKVIDENHEPQNFAGQGFCKKKLQEDSERAARVYRGKKIVDKSTGLRSNRKPGGKP